MPILVASEVMDLAAAALNDIDKTVYDYDTQIPYLKMALQELQEIFELNSLPVTEQSSAAIPLAAEASVLEFNTLGPSRLPDNLIEPQKLWERPTGTYPWLEMFRKDYIPASMLGTLTSLLTYWVWQNNKLVFIPSSADNDVRIDYIGSLFPKYLQEETILPVQNSIGYLAYKTAELISDMVEHNQERAASNAGRANLSLDRISGITIKGKQQILARRRPFRAAYRSR